MASPFISKIEIKDFGCIKDLTLHPTPLHALIGPNDSGKSTILAAIRAPFFRSSTVRDATIRGYYGYGSQIQIDIEFEGKKFPIQFSVSEKASVNSTNNSLECRLVRFDPDKLRESSRLIPENNPIDFLDSRGRGLPGVYDAIVNRDVRRFLEIENEIKKLFLPVSKLGLINVGSDQKVLAITLENDVRIGPESMSEGLLYYLGFLALGDISAGSILLVEEPENGLHPSRIADVMRILREISKKSQVILATHSPLVINELSGDEVSIITRDPEKGTQAVLLKDTHNYEERSRVYANGELWVSYADGETEHDLIHGYGK